MKSTDIAVGGRYVAKVSGRLTVVRVDRIDKNWEDRTRYQVTNEKTGRRTTFRSVSKFRGTACPTPTGVPTIVAYARPTGGLESLCDTIGSEDDRFAQR